MPRHQLVRCDAYRVLLEPRAQSNSRRHDVRRRPRLGCRFSVFASTHRAWLPGPPASKRGRRVRRSDGHLAESVHLDEAPVQGFY